MRESWVVGLGLPLSHPVIFFSIVHCQPRRQPSRGVCVSILFLFFLIYKRGVDFLLLYRAVYIAVFCGSPSSWSGMRIGGEGEKEGREGGLEIVPGVCLFAC